MIEGVFTQDCARDALSKLTALFNAMPTKTKKEYDGHRNAIALFIDAAERVAPTAAGMDLETPSIQAQNDDALQDLATFNAAIQTNFPEEQDQ